MKRLWLLALGILCVACTTAAADDTHRVFIPVTTGEGRPSVTATTTPATSTPTPSRTPTRSPTSTMTLTATASATWTATVSLTPTSTVTQAAEVEGPTGGGGVPTLPTATATPTMLVFVLAGQSNMGVNATFVSQAQPEDAALILAAGNWPPLIPGPRPGTVIARHGPGLFFARTLTSHGVSRIGLIGCAVGGSAINEWQSTQTFYRDCLTTVRSVGLPVAGVLFYQGEADARTDGMPTLTGVPRAGLNWDQRFGQVVAAFRSDLGAPSLPVVFVRIAHTADPGFDNWSLVQARQDAVRIPHVVEVDSEPAILEDSIHLNDASYAIVGERLALAWLATR